MADHITVADYFKAYAGNCDITPEHIANATALLSRVNDLLDECIAAGWQPTVNPATGTLLSGLKNGGWRPADCPIGAPNSSHKLARAVDIADPTGSLDELLDDEILTRHGLYRESPECTEHWCHLSDKAPGSGKRTFHP